MSPALTSDSSAPSVPERVIHHKWDGTKYSRADGNFTQWSEKLKDAMILNGIYAYVFDPILPCPSSDAEPRAHANWNLNDRLAITFLRSALDETRARQEGPIKQIALLQEALSTYCSQFESLLVMASRITNIVKRAFNIGKINADLFTCIALLNSLNNPSFEALQNSVSTLLSKSTKDLPCKPTDIRLLMENAQNIINSKANATAMALNAKGGIKPRNTDLPGHNHGPTQAKSLVVVTRLDGKLWYVDPTNLGQLPALSKTAAFAGIAGIQLPTTVLDHSTKCWEYAGFMAFKDPRTTILSWDDYTKPIEDHIMAADISPVPQARQTHLTSLTSTPFLVDSGATVHISPRHDDFLTLHPIPPCSVKGLGGSSVAAIGIGIIQLHVAKGANIILEDALYIPNATVRLVSIVNRSTRTLIAQDPLIPNQHLYSLNLDPAFTEHHALATHQTTDLETWHCCLGHANYQTISDMAKSGMVPDGRKITQNPKQKTLQPLNSKDLAVSQCRQQEQTQITPHNCERIQAQQRGMLQEALDQGPEATDHQGLVIDDPNLPDLSNLASIEDIKYLLSAVEELGNDPLMPNMDNEPQTWAEAKQSGDASRWEAAYCDELNSFHNMGVYKLVP
ncbi:hypothetical protein E4T56_gene14577 [Termitomyces sp. T112]|nr:hypothetical protein E4T56_gene14577 [Termitomyces sp. T112]